MEREKLLDICILFRIWEFEMTFGKIIMMWDALQLKKGEILVIYNDFICVSCILCVGMLESFKLWLGYELG
jgi:hypothetical protein